MIKDIKNKYVVDVIEPLHIIGSMEDSIILENCVCDKKTFDDGSVVYKDIVNGRTYYCTDKIGYTRVIKDSIRPLSLYYNVFGVPKCSKIDDRKRVRSKVRSLKRDKKI